MNPTEPGETSSDTPRAARPPERIVTARLVVRRWQPADAPLLKDALDPSVAHLQPWIPWSVAEPAAVPVLAARLADFVADFDAGREWTWGIFPHDESVVLGGIGLYPRIATGRVAIGDADRIEAGYWLRVDATGQGYATEAARAVVDAGLALPGIMCIEIRCDPRNARSAAIPRRLGFQHARTIAEPAAADGTPRELMIWERPVAPVDRTTRA